MKAYITPQVRIINLDATSMLAASDPTEKVPVSTDIKISEPEDILTKKSLWDETW